MSNGVEIPKLGLGTWFIDNDDATQAVRDATTIGYRHIDTAQAYGNEAGIGEGIRSCGVPREQMFVTTKLAADIKSFKEAATAIDKSLATTGLDYLDMVIIHSPQPWDEFGGNDRYFEGNRDAWRALEQAYEARKLRAIGLSNFQAADVDVEVTEEDREVLKNVEAIADYGDASMFPVYSGASFRLPRTASEVLLVAHPLPPGDVRAVEGLLNRDVRHGGFGRRPVPVP